MQTPEEFARSALDDGRVSIWEHQADEIAALADLIRERDAAVRADERAKVLAGFTEERSLVDAKGVHYFKVGDPPPDDGLRPVRRHVSPWEPTP